MKCPKCGFEQADSANECVRCGLVFHKFEALQRKKEQLQARYSPQSGNGEAAVADPPAAEAAAPEAPSLTLEQTRELKRQFEKLYAGVQGVLKFHTSLGDELTSHRASFRELATQFGNLQGTVEQQVMQLQARMEELDARVASLREEVQLNRHPADVGESLQAIGKGLDELLRQNADGHGAADLKKRLDRLETLQGQIRGAIETAPARADGDWAAQETLLIKSELQALRAEVRTLMDQPTPADAAAETPAVDLEALNRDLDLRVREAEQRLAAGGSAIEARLQELEARLADDAAAAEQKLAAAEESAAGIRDRLQELEAEQAELTKVESSRKDLVVEIQGLRKTYQTFAKESRSDLDKQAGSLAKMGKEIDALKTNVAQLRDTMERLRKIFSKA